jgi:hypothetical protein
MPPPAAYIVGALVLQPPGNLAGARATVSLQDTTLADAPAREIATLDLELAHHDVSRIRFCLEVPVGLSRDARYSLQARILRHAGEEPAPGDYLNTVAVHWHPDLEQHVEIPVRKIPIR